MREQKLDRRVVRTRQLLRSALLALILEKGYDAVTVQEIAERANLGRATFYLHYPGGKDELLSSSLEEIYAALVERIQRMTHEEILSGSSPPSLIAFQHAAENRDLYRIILSGQGAGAVARRIREYLAGVIQSQLKQRVGENNDTLPFEVIANYMAGALITLIAWWLENNMPHSAEEMSQIFFRLTSQGTTGLLTSGQSSNF
jgi:AcrR family transcriptional regulator